MVTPIAVRNTIELRAASMPQPSDESTLKQVQTLPCSFGYTFSGTCIEIANVDSSVSKQRAGKARKALRYIWTVQFFSPLGPYSILPDVL